MVIIRSILIKLSIITTMTSLWSLDLLIIVREEVWS